MARRQTIGTVSLIITVKDEAEAIAKLLDSIAAQTRPPDEVVVVDGGSRDGTVEVISAWASTVPFSVRLEVQEGYNISQGRNRAIRVAGGQLIASTDAGVRLSPGWLEELVAPLEQGECQVASGFFLPDSGSTFEVALAATALPALGDIDPGKFLPSSRSIAFLKCAWEAVGGYPEWLDYCEDLVFDFSLRERGHRFQFVPGAVVYFRPRASLAAFSRQYYRYGRGDGKADLWPARHAARYISYLVLLPLTLTLAMLHHPLWFMAPLAGAAACLYTPYKRLVRLAAGLPPLEMLKAILGVPVIRVTGDVAKMLGYPVGRFWRWRHGLP